VSDVVTRQESCGAAAGEGGRNHLAALRAHAWESRACVLVWRMHVKRSSGESVASALVSHRAKITPGNPVSAGVVYYSSSSVIC